MCTQLSISPNKLFILAIVVTGMEGHAHAADIAQIPADCDVFVNPGAHGNLLVDITNHNNGWTISKARAYKSFCSDVSALNGKYKVNYLPDGSMRKVNPDGSVVTIPATDDIAATLQALQERASTDNAAAVGTAESRGDDSSVDSPVDPSRSSTSSSTRAVNGNANRCIHVQTSTFQEGPNGTVWRGYAINTCNIKVVLSWGWGLDGIGNTTYLNPGANAFLNDCYPSREACQRGVKFHAEACNQQTPC